MDTKGQYDEAARMIDEARRIVAFTGAGISVESGIPTFRGAEGLWSRYDPKILDLGYFFAHPRESWEAIREIFYDYMGANARPNAAHRFLARLEEAGSLIGVITQNIDNLHQEAGSRTVVEFHGTARTLVCTECRDRTPFTEHDLSELPPRCTRCGGVLKPDFVFFGESIPPEAWRESERLLGEADLLIVVGTTGEVAPASMLPYQTRAPMIEINVEPSRYTADRTDLYLEDKATVAARELAKRLGIEL